MTTELPNLIKFSEGAEHHDVPRLQLELGGKQFNSKQEVSLTLPYTLEITIKCPNSPVIHKPIIFDWGLSIDGHLDPGFTLLRHTATGLDLVKIEHSARFRQSPTEPRLVTWLGQDFWELSPGQSRMKRTPLPEVFQKNLIADETYTVLWTGVQLGRWAYGSLKEYEGKELPGNEYPLTIPGGPRLTFSVHQEIPPWPERKEREDSVGFSEANQEEEAWRRLEALQTVPFPLSPGEERSTGAPKLHVTLECPPSFRRQDEHFDITVKVTYVANSDARPVIFRVQIFQDFDNYQLGRLRNGSWICYDNGDDNTGFMLVDDPDVPLNVGESDKFVSLQPGESWTKFNRLHNNYSYLPDDTKDGEVLRYAFTGNSLDWWDWGTKADHAKTVVKVPCFLWGPVVDPKDNGGRPELIVSTSNVVEFAVMK